MAAHLLLGAWTMKPPTTLSWTVLSIIARWGQRYSSRNRIPKVRASSKPDRSTLTDVMTNPNGSHAWFRARPQ